MVKKSNAAVSAVLGLVLAGALMGASVAPASAAPGQVCYFGECSASASSGPASERPAEARQVSQHGGWRGVQIGQGALVYDQFDNGAKFGILLHPEGRFGLMLSHPEWRLRKGQQVDMSIRIDDEVYNGKAVVNESGVLEADNVGKALVTAVYRGRKGRITVGDYHFDMNNLADAAATIDDVMASLKRAAR